MPYLPAGLCLQAFFLKKRTQWTYYHENLQLVLTFRGNMW